MKTFAINRVWLSMGALAICAAMAGSSAAQYQVNQPGDPAPNAPNANPNAANSPTRKPGVELYGNNNRDKPVLYPAQSEPLPSEILIATQRSGATPSELRTRADALGPLTPNGRADYIPPLSPYELATGLTPPVIFGPAWSRPAVGYRPLPPGPGVESGPQTSQTGEKNRRRIEGSPLNVTPDPLLPTQPFNAQIPPPRPLGPVTYVNTTVTRPLHYIRPTTQPTTAPSLAPTARPTGK